MKLIILVCLITLISINIVSSKNWRKNTHKRKKLTTKFHAKNNLGNVQTSYTTNLTNAEYLLKGYDIYKADPLTPSKGVDPGFTRNLFNLTWGSKTSDQSYYKPIGFDVAAYTSCSASLSSRSISTVDELSNELKWSVGAEVKLGTTPVSVGGSYGQSSLSEIVNNGQNVIIINTATCIVYKYSFQSNENIVLSNDVLYSLAKLQNKTFTEYPDLFYAFYDEWGTHYQKSGYMGSKINYISEMSASQYSSLTSEGWNVEVSVGVEVGAASIKASGGYETTTEVSKQLNTTNLSTKIFSIGASLVDTGESSAITTWQQNSAKTPLPVVISTDKITNLLYLDKWDTQMKQNNITRVSVIAELANAYDTYCKYLASKSSKYSCETTTTATLGETQFSSTATGTQTIQTIIKNTNVTCNDAQAIHSFKFNLLQDNFGYSNDWVWEWLCSSSGNISRDCYNKQTALVTMTGSLSDLNNVDIVCKDGYAIKSYTYEVIDSVSYYGSYYCCKASMNTDTCSTKTVSYTSDYISDLYHLNVNGDSSDAKTVLNSIDFNWDSDTELMSFKYKVCTLNE